MDELILEGTKKTLNVRCTHGFIEFSGCSITGNPRIFFQPVFDWIRRYIKNPAEITIVNCHIEYLDTASLKYLNEIFFLLVGIKSRSADIRINWKVSDNDPEILDIGQILEKRLKYNFNFIYE